ncbi:Integrase zinc binding domain [Popillia japonica]|uniref:RNA-directed DNA polymerase n=1 Tax=Popillia japonica TaxID=7064 RepID=A0AAW1MDX7_POPJA
MVKTKQLLRSKVWFPNIDKMVELEIKTCSACQIVTPQHTRDPVVRSDLLSASWENLDIDFAGPYPGGKYLLILIDEHTRYPIVEVISTLDAQTVTKKLRHIFAMFGLPKRLKGDNGPPFSSNNFKEKLRHIFAMFGLPKRLKGDNGPPFSSNNFKVFLDEFNIEYHRVTPYWPEANGLAERSVRTIKKAILCANIILARSQRPS